MYIYIYIFFGTNNFLIIIDQHMIKPADETTSTTNLLTNNGINKKPYVV